LVKWGRRRRRRVEEEEEEDVPLESPFPLCSTSTEWIASYRPKHHHHQYILLNQSLLLIR
jgi:hypothetical protein